MGLSLRLLSFLAFATSIGGLFFLWCCHEDLAVFELLIDVLLVVVIYSFRLNLLGNLFTAWGGKTLLGFELVAEDDKALASFDLLKLWVLSILDF